MSTSDLLSLLSLLVGLGGFALTLAQLNKIKSASEAATSATNKLKTRINIIDYSSACQHSSQHLQTSLLFITSQDWQSAANQIDSARHLIAKIEENEKCSEESRRYFGQTTHKLLDITTILDKIIANKTQNFPLKEIRSIREIVSKLEAEVTKASNSFRDHSSSTKNSENGSNK